MEDQSLDREFERGSRFQGIRKLLLARPKPIIGGGAAVESGEREFGGRKAFPGSYEPIVERDLGLQAGVSVWRRMLQSASLRVGDEGSIATPKLTA